MPTQRRQQIWALAITGLALFMVVLDNLVVTTALPVIRTDLDMSLDSLGWVVNAYTLSFAVLLLTGAALGDRLGRRRMFAAGILVFAAASAGCALAGSPEALIAFRAIQGAGAAMVMPLSLTLLTDAFPPGKRGMALGIWSGISGLAVAAGPVIGGAVVDGISWHWIFWPNVPLGVLTAVLAVRAMTESRGAPRRLDLPGMALAGAGLLGVVWGLVRGNGEGWTSPEILLALGLGTLFLAAFVAWEARSAHPMLPLGMFRSRGFTIANAVSVAMYFGMFGAIFFLAQFLQTVQGNSPLKAGLMILPWTVMPMFVAPIAGAMSDRVGARPLMVSGLALQAGALAWLALASSPDVGYGALLVPFAMAGAGMALVFPPVANLLVASVPEARIGVASGANNTMREVGGALGIAVMTAVFTATGGYASPQAYVDGLTPSVLVGAAVVAAGALLALAVPGRRAARIPAQAAAEAA
ncbi:MAG: DHA2 family efflux MFS transporter permease subunit [Thermoleophilia bacterium]|nr:DHA2 family efflux MFS transporter permease subunit [Thermoleophilia bacterium]